MATPKMRLDYDPVDGRSESDTNHIGNGVGYTHGLGTLDDTNSRFFRKSGSDFNTGTQASPYKTQNKAQIIVNPHGTYDYAVCLDSGIYDEAHILPADGKYCVTADGLSPRFTRGYGARESFVPIGKYTGGGTEYFVDGINGNDGWNGLTEVWDGVNGPKKTFQAGVNLMTAGNDRLQIAYAIYNEQVTLYDAVDARYIYAKEGEMPIVRKANGVCLLTPTNNNAVRVLIEGIIFDGVSKTSPGIQNNVNAGTDFLKVHDCTFQNCTDGYQNTQNLPGGIEIIRCKISECEFGIDIDIDSVSGLTAAIEFNYFEKCLTNASTISTGSTTKGWTISFKHNIVNRSKNGFLFEMDGDAVGPPPAPGWDIQNNTTWLHTDANTNTYAMRVDFVGAKSYTFWNNICVNLNVGIPNYGIWVTGGTLNGDNCCYNSVNGNISFTASVQTSNPLFNRPYGDEAFLGVRHDSPCFRTGRDGYEDMGANWNLFYLGAFITPNFYGITFDGQKKWFSAFRTGVVVGDKPKIISSIVENFVGTGFLIDTVGDFIYQKNIIRRNGSGLYATFVELDSQNNIFHDNLHWGAYKATLNVTTNLKNNVYFKNRIGHEWTSAAPGETITNCIFQGNSEYGLFSGGSIIRYAVACCLADTYNTYVDVSDSGNIFASPLFVNIEEETEDFHIRTEWGGYPLNSPCKDAASGGGDIGAWQVSRTGAISFSTFVFLANPKRVRERWEKVRPVESTAQSGKTRTSVDAINKIFNLIWTEDFYSPDAQSELFDYIAAQAMDLRFWPRGNSSMLTGTGTVSGVNNTLTDASLSGNIRKDRYRSYWVLIDSKYYKCTANTVAGVFTLEDPDDTLPTGSKTYSIDYVKTRVRAANRFSADRPLHKEEMPRTGYDLDLIEV